MPLMCAVYAEKCDAIFFFFKNVYFSRRANKIAQAFTYFESKKANNQIGFV